MFRSAILRLADKATRRPIWLELNGRRHVEVQGFSPRDNIAFGILAAFAILAPIIFILATAP